MRTTAKTHAMRWFEAALAARAITRRRQGRRLGVAVLAAALLLAVTGAGSAAPAARTGVFTGYGFEACNAPSTDALTAWLASPYRAVGIYIGGDEPHLLERRAHLDVGRGRARDAAGA